MLAPLAEEYMNDPKLGFETEKLLYRLIVPVGGESPMFYIYYR